MFVVGPDYSLLCHQRNRRMDVWQLALDISSESPDLNPFRHVCSGDSTRNAKQRPCDGAEQQKIGRVFLSGRGARSLARSLAHLSTWSQFVVGSRTHDTEQTYTFFFLFFEGATLTGLYKK